MKPFARINLSSVALRRGILVTSLALAAGCASTLKVDNAPVAALRVILTWVSRVW